MPKLVVDIDGSLKWPEETRRRVNLPVGTQYWLDRRDGALILLPRLPDLRKLYIEPTTACNLACRTCIRNVWTDPEVHMELDLFERLVEQTWAFPDLKRVVLSGLGEPLTHPHILDMIRLLRARGLAVTLSTNGLLLDRAISRELVALGVDRLVISLDGVEPETYARVRGTLPTHVLDNIHGLNEAKRERNARLPALRIEFVALKSNVAELPHLTELASRLGAARVLVSNVLAYTEEMRDQILYGYEPRAPLSAGLWPMPQADTWILLGVLDLPRLHWGAEPRCGFVRDRAAVIGWDGCVVPCYALSHNHSYLAIDGRRKQVTRYALGNVAEQSLLDIWTGEEYCRFRNEVRDHQFPSCPDCDLRETCDLREQNEACWGWNPSCADCLWAQDIIRCP